MADGVEEATDVVTSIFILREYFQQGSFCIYVIFYLILHKCSFLRKERNQAHRLMWYVSQTLVLSRRMDKLDNNLCSTLISMVFFLFNQCEILLLSILNFTYL